MVTGCTGQMRSMVAAAPMVRCAQIGKTWCSGVIRIRRIEADDDKAVHWNSIGQMTKKNQTTEKQRRGNILLHAFNAMCWNDVTFDSWWLTTTHSNPYCIVDGWRPSALSHRSHDTTGKIAPCKSMEITNIFIRYQLYRWKSNQPKCIVNRWALNTDSLNDLQIIAATVPWYARGVHERAECHGEIFSFAFACNFAPCTSKREREEGGRSPH